jgi:hypothetical protein
MQIPMAETSILPEICELMHIIQQKDKDTYNSDYLFPSTLGIVELTIYKWLST